MLVNLRNFELHKVPYHISSASSNGLDTSSGYYLHKPWGNLFALFPIKTYLRHNIVSPSPVMLTAILVIKANANMH